MTLGTGRWLQFASLLLFMDLFQFSLSTASPGGSGQSLPAPGKSALGSMVWGLVMGLKGGTLGLRSLFLDILPMHEASAPTQC